ncbi:MAG TPA: BTAD domain-containing putative transcriptional regulator [Trebonia sp.]|nr:BTAD domain-containing putative transcriptional regulator [Trebonia sp.]
MRVAILGPFEVRNGTGDCLPVAGSRLRDLVIRLALAGGRPVSTAALAEAVWGEEPPADMANALQTLVSRARRALGGPGTVEQSAAGYRLAVTEDDVDALRFERLVTEGRGPEALALWRGPALADAGEFALPYAHRLDGLRTDATIAELTREADRGQADARVSELESLAAEHPLNEKVTALLMRALAVTGRQAGALAAYERLRARLADELGIDPSSAVQAVHLEVLRGKAGSGDAGRPLEPQAQAYAARPRPRTNLRTQLTSFVGRHEEAGRVAAALAGYRLVTLVGPGGAGKTRLACEVAAGIGDQAPDGVWLAELASVTDGADVPQAVLGSIGIRESRIMIDGSQRASARDAQTRLLDGLADARALIVLDNCEHLIDACAHLADSLLAHSPRLRIVATSREPLGIVGESLFVVPPLGQDPAVTLFADRAAAVSPGFRLDDDTLPLVAEIVRRLDGLPLAIELAAARLRTLPLAEISRRLNDRFRLLTGGSRTALPRHRTLRAVVEWSWDLLSPAERLLAERFSVFPAGATPEAVAAVAGTGDLRQEDVDELLSSLVDKSLLQLAADGTRLRMLETIREFAADMMTARAAGEPGQWRRRHAGYYSGLMAEAMPNLLTRDQLTWLKRVEADRDNVLAALRYWCEAGEAGPAIDLSVSVAWLAFLLGNHGDIVDLVGQAVGVPGEADPDLRTIAEAIHLITASITPEAREDPDAEVNFRDLADRVDALDIEKHPFAGLLRAGYAMFLHDSARARAYVDDALASRDEWLVAATWMISAAIAENDGDMDALRAASVQALERFRALGERWGLSSALRVAGSVRMLDGDLEGAAACYGEAGRVLHEMGSRDDESQMRLQLADIAARRGDLDGARALFTAALEACEREGSGMEAAIVSAGFAMFEVTFGNAELARVRHATAAEGIALLSPNHPARHHLTAVVWAAGLLLAIADADLPLARERAVRAFQEAIDSRDMPLVATVAGATAHLARALGRPAHAAEMLGACAAVRGAEDRTDLTLTMLGPRLRDEIGPGPYAAAYDRGKALSRAEALALLDPASL